MKQCISCGEMITNVSRECKYCLVKQEKKDKIEYKTINIYSKYGLNSYCEMLPKLGFEIMSINTDVSGSTGSTIKNYKSGFGNKHISEVTNSNTISTTYVAALKRNINNINPEILKITEEYVNLFDIMPMKVPSYMATKIIELLVISVIALFLSGIFLILFRPVINLFFDLSISENQAATIWFVGFLILFFYYLFSSIKNNIAYKKEYVENNKRYQELQDIVNKFN